MASAEVDRPVALEIVEPSDHQDQQQQPERNKPGEPSQHEKHRNDKKKPTGPHNKRYCDGRSFRPYGRKRSHSFNGGGGKFGPPYKKFRRGFIVPPTKFLLGGNIWDPLNLNSLQDEEINRAMNAVTPQSSPLPTPKHRKEEIEVLIPPNIHDPLNLTAPDEEELNLISPKKKKSRNRRRKSGGAAAAAAAAAAQAAATSDESKPSTDGASTSQHVFTAPLDPSKPQTSTPNKQLAKKGRNDRRPRRSIDDKIVSPVIPQPGGWRHRPPIFNRNLSWDNHPGPKHRRRRRPNKNQPTNMPPPKIKPEWAKFQYGNYNKYYGYRNPDESVDMRMKFLRKDLFHGKEVLDIGCNVGHLTLNIASQFAPKRVVGMDIDQKLLVAARNNVRHFASRHPVDCEDSFPASLSRLFGPLDPPVDPTRSKTPKFPHNISFQRGNYVLDSDVLLATVKQEYDVILCLSVTKWFHLNFGDEGLKRSFRRMHAQLRPGGKLILEAQPWHSYKSKKKLTETIFKNYSSIQLFPQKFTEYLLGSEVGFTKCELLGTPLHQAKGFQRPIQMFTKADIPYSSPSETVPSTACGDAALPTETSLVRLDVPPVLLDEEWEEPNLEELEAQEATPPQERYAEELEAREATPPHARYAAAPSPREERSPTPEEDRGEPQEACEDAPNDCNEPALGDPGSDDDVVEPKRPRLD